MYIDKKSTVVWLCDYCMRYIGNAASIDMDMDPGEFIPPPEKDYPNCPICHTNSYMVAYSAIHVGKLLPDNDKIIELKKDLLAKGYYVNDDMLFSIELVCCNKNI